MGSKRPESTSSWSLDAGGLEVTMCKFDWAISLVLADVTQSYELRIEGDLILSLEGGTTTISPGPEPRSGAPVLDLLHRPILRLEAFEDGRLDATFGGGAALRAEAGTDYEAWELAGPAGLRIVSLPGGELAVWSASGDLPVGRTSGIRR